MAPPRKRARSSRPHKEDSPVAQQSLNALSDYRTSWLLKGEDQVIELKVKGETFQVAKSVLTKTSEYFDGCLNSQFVEAKKRVIDFGDGDDDIQPRYLGLYLGVAYSHVSMVPHTTPRPATNPEMTAARTPLREWVEVYKLCNRFISTKMGDYIEECIDVAIGDGHRALFRTHGDEAIQRLLMRDFAAAYEALYQENVAQRDMGNRMVSYFCEAVSYGVWSNSMTTGTLDDHPRFVAHVSRGFALKLLQLEGSRKLKRKELSGPSAQDP
ncbi:hypothetical protein B0J15DRAFT_152089 [Fusarium solani]|uniref:BTB domain-containing protein n=1 Tax=Fusarium solani TaxID=169388 RepID=A0A9P9GB05_FUSSL|nr:uncharacterized protein B0J15DRAFT_152089 [Fusarium solani]KAH7235280.1 hypothetical protein B0J15DRAFT_152089 [Fusarium solani]